MRVARGVILNYEQRQQLEQQARAMSLVRGLSCAPLMVGGTRISPVSWASLPGRQRVGATAFWMAASPHCRRTHLARPASRGPC